MTKILAQKSKMPNAAARIIAMGTVKTIENKMAQTTGVTIAATNPRPREAQGRVLGISAAAW
jgi:hypothetical protein